ncbi:MAG: gluconate:H+ symporter [Ignavibacteria bacterium]
MLLTIAVIGLVLLFLLILAVRINAFIAFIIVSIFIGIASGMELDKIVSSVEKGLGDTLGFLALILGFGAMLGKLAAESGAAQRITSKLIAAFGVKRIQWAVMLTGFIVGVPLFYAVGFVILVPIIFTVAAAVELPLLYVALPMIASLTVTHGYLPPHPSPTAIAVMFHADIGKTLLLGILIAVPAIIIAGPFLSRFLKKINAKPFKEFFNPRVFTEEEMPSFTVSIFTLLLPVILIAGASLLNIYLPESILKHIINFLGNAPVAMLISVLLGIYTLGLNRGKSMNEVMELLTKSVSSITMVLLIIGGAGSFKQVMLDSGISNYIGELLKDSPVQPLILAWLIATALRICVGSATVAAVTTAGILLPYVSTASVNPELLVLSIGAGSLMLSQVNDIGFWMFKEYFSLSIKETLLSWTVMETIVGIVGLIGVLVMNAFI